MQPFKYYIQTILQDEFNIIEDAVKTNNLNIFSFILLDLKTSNNKKNIGHYIAIYCNMRDDH